MTAYEFSRMNADFTAQVRARSFEASVVAFQIEYAHKDRDPRMEAEYVDAKHIFIECTMSCEPSEALDWMKYWMADAIAYAIVTKERNWQYFYLAAYDLYNSLLKQVKH